LARLRWSFASVRSLLASRQCFSSNQARIGRAMPGMAASKLCHHGWAKKKSLISLCSRMATMHNSATTAIAITRLIAIHFLTEQLVRFRDDDLGENGKSRYGCGGSRTASTKGNINRMFFPPTEWRIDSPHSAPFAADAKGRE